VFGAWTPALGEGGVGHADASARGGRCSGPRSGRPLREAARGGEGGARGGSSGGGRGALREPRLV
jgi:hypothetical protein